MATPDTTQSARPRIDLHDIQGNVVGFNKDHQRFVFLQFADQPSGRAFLADVAGDLANAWEVREFNQLFKEAHKRGAPEGEIEASWTNLALTFAGLQVVGATGLEAFPPEFSQPIVDRAAQVIGDVNDSAPENWVAPFRETIHAMAIFAADAPEDLERHHERLVAKAQAHGVTVLEPAIDGNTRPDPNRGHEHFGFKDGISQPGIDRITTSSKGGRDTIATGEFLIGYPDQDGHVSGQAVPAPLPGEPGYPNPGPQPVALPDWTKNGSFAVFRRLRQNVGAFNQFVRDQAALTGGNSELLGAKLMGRWKSGAPLEVTGEQPTDPGPGDPKLLDDRHINRFEYQAADADGHVVPRAAHIRKANPRDETPPGQDESNRHRIARRGITYGPEFVESEPPYPGGPVVPDDQDRGLLFLCYQASLSRGFEFVQTQWANKPDFPAGGNPAGRDPIISQDVAEREFELPPSNPHVLIQRWVQTTGTVYALAPSISALKALGTE